MDGYDPVVYNWGDSDYEDWSDSGEDSDSEWGDSSEDSDSEDE
jgi:hypothetical protein